MIMPDRAVRDYQLFPRIVPADKISRCRIVPRGEHASFLRAAKISMELFPVSGLDSAGNYSGESEKSFNWQLLPDGSVEIEAFFAGEQEFTLQIEMEEFGHPQGAKHPLTLQLGLYSLYPDLYGLLPLRGDMHIHSELSDGEYTPELMAARGRQLGMDFLAVTDHGKYAPSLQAMEKFSNIPSGLTLFPGEEVQLPGTPVHIVNFGGSRSINDLARQDEEQYRREASRLASEMKNLTSGSDPFPIGAAEWSFHQIRKCGGIGIFCHCFWQRHHYMISESVTWDILKNCHYDGAEAVSGHGIINFWSNNLQSSLLGEAAPGINFYGTSDAHSPDQPNEFGCVYTVLFAKGTSRNEITESLRNGVCVAAEEQTGMIPRFYGKFRFVRYAAFLRKHYFPHHDELCAAEGVMLAELFAGNKKVLPAIQAASSAVSDYRNALFLQKR